MFEQLAGIPAICVRSFRRFCRRPPEPFRSLFPDLSVNRWLNRWFIATNIYYPGDFAKTIYNYIIIQIYGHEIEMYTVEQGEKRDKRQ